MRKKILLLTVCLAVAVVAGGKRYVPVPIDFVQRMAGKLTAYTDGINAYYVADSCRSLYPDELLLNAPTVDLDPTTLRIYNP